MTDRRFIQHQHLNNEGDRLKVECRFCRHPQEYNKYIFVAPCGCAGSTRFVHRTCLERWAIVKFQHVYNQPDNGDPQEFNVFCEMCQQRMEIEFSLINKFSKYEDCVEKINDHRLLFALLMFFAVASITAIIFMGITAVKSANGFSSTVILVFSISFIVLVGATVVFFWKFMIIRSIDIDKIPNNKDPPKIVNFSDQDNEEVPNGPSQDPYFGGQSVKHEHQFDKSLMLQSKRSAQSVVSKTFTDILMKKMYNHDNISVKNMKDRENEQNIGPQSRKDVSNNLRDRDVQVTRYQKKDQQKQMSNLNQKRDQSLRGNIYQKDQNSLHFNNQSIQPSNQQKDVSVQPNGRKRRIFNQNLSIEPPSSTIPSPLPSFPPLPAPSVPSPKERNYLTELPMRDQIQEEAADQQRSNSNGSSNEQKRSDEDLVPDKPKQSKLKLKNSKSPIKIRVVF